MVPYYIFVFSYIPCISQTVGNSVISSVHSMELNLRIIVNDAFLPSVFVHSVLDAKISVNSILFYSHIDEHIIFFTVGHLIISVEVCNSFSVVTVFDCVNVGAN